MMLPHRLDNLSTILLESDNLSHNYLNVMIKVLFKYC